MKMKNEVLEAVRKTPLPVYELRERLELSPMKMLSLLKFLDENKLVETMAGDNLVMMMKITPHGLQLLKNERVDFGAQYGKPMKG